jgi:hypothetical protein
MMVTMGHAVVADVLRLTMVPLLPLPLTICR